MTLHIDDVGLLVLAVGLLVGHATYQHTEAAAGAASKGDIVGAIAAAAVITALFPPFGGGGSASAGPAEAIAPGLIHSPDGLENLLVTGM
ncbi:hypothetical protein ACWCYZ_42915 [Streptomyces virginiae]